MNWVREHVALIAALFIFWGVIALTISVNVARSEGFAYTLDDAYIHLAIANNWIDHGVWGVTRYEWGSSTSSLVWTSLLGVLMKVGIPGQIWYPLWLNLLAGSAAIMVVYRWIHHTVDAQSLAIYKIGTTTLQGARAHAVRWVEFWVLVVFIFVTCLPDMVQSGMEHSLQILLTLLVVVFAGQIAATPKSAWGKREIIFLVLVCIMSSTRYENLFVVAAIVLVFAWQKRWNLIAAVIASAVLPLALYAWLSVEQGWYPLPNSVIMKSNLDIREWQDVLGVLFGINVIRRLLIEPSYIITPILYLAFGAIVGKLYLAHRQQRTLKHRATETMLVLFLWTLFLQINFSSGWLALASRYSTYFFAMALMALGYLAVEYMARSGKTQNIEIRWQSIPNELAVIALVIIVAFPFTVRAMKGVYGQWYGSSNIHEQQIQMARFLGTYYTGESVAANDIGAINYFADIRCFDLKGLANIEVARETHKEIILTEAIDRLTQADDVKIAVIYDDWFPADSPSAPPAHWIPVAQWTIPQQVTAAFPTVTFYATSPSEAERLHTSLEAFAAYLPERVVYQPTFNTIP